MENPSYTPHHDQSPPTPPPASLPPSPPICAAADCQRGLLYHLLPYPLLFSGWKGPEAAKLHPLTSGHPQRPLGEPPQEAPPPESRPKSLVQPCDRKPLDRTTLSPTSPSLLPFGFEGLGGLQTNLQHLLDVSRTLPASQTAEKRKP